MDIAGSVKRGIVGGMAGGFAFGGMMGGMGMLPMIGGMIGRPSAVAGFGVHMMMSAGIGAVFGLLVGGFRRSFKRVVAAGVGYGALWWVLGPLTFMPWLMGMGFGANWTAAGVSGSMPSLMGHLIFGAALGLTYDRLGQSRRSEAVRASGHAV